jgi:hypothetical protein
MAITTDAAWLLDEKSPEQMASWFDLRAKDVRSLRGNVESLVWQALGDLALSPLELERQVNELQLKALFLEELVKFVAEARNTRDAVPADEQPVVEAVKAAGRVFTEEVQKIRDAQKLVHDLVTVSQRRMKSPS